MKKALLLAFVCAILLAALLGCDRAPKIEEPQVHSIEEVRRELQQDKGQYPQELVNAQRKKFPQYFDLGDFKGLEVYAWLSDGEYYCGVLSGTNRLNPPRRAERADIQRSHRWRNEGHFVLL